MLRDSAKVFQCAIELYSNLNSFAYPGRALGGDGAVMGGLDLLFSLSEIRVLGDDDDELILVLFTAAFSV